MQKPGPAATRWLLLVVVVVGAVTTVAEAAATDLVAAKQYPRQLPPRPRFTNDVYPTASPNPARPQFSVALARNMSQTTDLREFIMKFVEDERICSSPSLRRLILGEDKSDTQAQLWWNRRCGGRRGNPFNSNSSPELTESTLLRYRRKSSNRDRRKNTEDLSQKDQQKLAKLLRDKRVLCKPKKMVVPLPNDEPNYVMLKPPCVYIKQCSGCCDHTLLECTPVRNKTKKFPVMAIRTDGGRRKFNDNSVVRYVRVEEHKKCQCECKVKAHHCSHRQVYNREACQCTCPSSSFRHCPRGKVWSERECDCICSDTSECTTGRYFDRNTCRCADPPV